MKKVTLIPGDGIGPSITDATVKVLDAAGAQISWDTQLAGVAAVRATGDPIPDATLESIKGTGLALKGPLETPVGEGFRSINVALRKTFDLYANVRPAHVILRNGRFDEVDIVLIRENTEGLYIGIEHYIRIGDDHRAAAESTAVVTRFGAERVCRYAFEYARKHGRRKVTLAHKANILKFSQGLFLDVGRAIAQQYPDIEFNERIIDALAMELVLKPEQFDVIVTTNLFGDIISDLISGLVGGLGLAPGANIGQSGAIFEAVHGTAPSLVGKNVANPGALMFAACLLLEHIGDGDRARKLRTAVEETLREGKAVTPDVGGKATTTEFTDEIIRKLRENGRTGERESGRTGEGEA
ncbi:MAG TPA: isocitrate/isopropylmalate family dehydrogenase [Gemmatimonadaceae bacterium]|nr:isocitrate/isopropylmalate family dehydrogenase [Gemmatimonadaceae bacterium]